MDHSCFHLIKATIIFLVISQTVQAGKVNGIVTEDGINLFAAGDSGLIMISSNSGTSWSLNYYVPDNFKSIAVNSDTCLLGTDNGKFFHLVNGQLQLLHNFDPDFSVNSISIVSSTTFFICGSSGKIYKTTSRGKNWQLINKNIETLDLNSIAIRNDFTGIVVGEAGKIYSTLNGGLSWVNEVSGTNSNLLRVKILADSAGVCGEAGTYLKFRYGHWQKVDLKTKSDVRGIAIDSFDKIHICGGEGFIRNNKVDSIFNNFETNPSLERLCDMTFYGQNGWAVNLEDVSVIKSTNSGDDWKFTQNFSQSYVWESKIPNQHDGYGNTLCMHPNDPNSIFVMYSDTVFLSRNKGDSWFPVSTLNMPGILRAHTFAVNYADTNTWLAIVSSNMGFYLVRTSNHGVTWDVPLSNFEIGGYTKPLEISKADPNFVYLATTDSGLYRSTNAGVSFQRIGSYEFMNPCDILVNELDPLTLLIADASYYAKSGDSSNILKSTNGGLDFSVKIKIPLNEIPALANSVFEPENVLATSDDLYESTNFGDSWRKLNTGHGPLWSLDICKEDLSCIVTGQYSGNGFNTTNSGLTFNSFNRPSSSAAFSAVIFPERNYAIGMFQNGVYKLRFFNNTNVGIHDQSSAIDNFLLYQNFPNPFNPSTTIKYELNKAQIVSLKVFDITGKEISTLVNQWQESGTHVAEFYGEGLSSGIYFYVLNSDDTHECRKMILLR